jgi:hypothetical protein
MTRTLTIIGAPSSAGAHAPGQEKAPAAFRSHGLVEALRARGRRVVDVDLDAPDTSDGALDWTGVAHLLDIPGSADDLSGLAGVGRCCRPAASFSSPRTTPVRQNAKRCSA